MADIVVADLTPRVQSTAGGGGPTVFDFSFPVFEQTDLTVYQTPVGSSPNDATQLLVYNVDYTVTINASPAVGGSITLMVGATAGDIITIVRDQPYNYLDNFLDGGLFEATQVNTAFDQAVMMTQQNKMYDRTVGLHYNLSANPVIGVDTFLPLLTPGAVWQMNSGGTAIEAVTGFTSGSGTVSLPTIANHFMYSTNTTGNLASSEFRMPLADGTPGQAMVTDGAGNLSFASIDVDTWGVITANQILAIETGYLTNGAGELLLTLPTVAAVGSVIRIATINAAGFSVTQNVGQSIIVGNHTTTVGVGGSMTTTNTGDSVELVCAVANTLFIAVSQVGNFDVI